MALLDDKELTILQFAADGDDCGIIAVKVQMARQTVKNKLRVIRVKLDAPTTVNAVATAIRRNLID